jgi:hypothetical protein
MAWCRRARLLMVAPMSGHYATLLRGTVERLLERAEVYITDWADAKYVPLAEGHFDLDDYIDYLIGFLEHIGPGAHDGGVPAFGARLCRHGRAGREEAPVPPADPDDDGRPDRHPRARPRSTTTRSPSPSSGSSTT